MTLPQRHQQRGAVLVIALVMLLIITLLGIGSMREVVLEGRITGNLIEQKRLRNAAESALREAERRISLAGDIDHCDYSDSPCYIADALDYSYDFSDSNVVDYSGLDGETTLEREARWYIRYVTFAQSSFGGGTNDDGSGCGALCSVEAAPSGSQFFYEVNAQAYKDGDAGDTCTAATLCLTSTTLLIKK
ncbi:PilX N-terminal domain-containing pilus assembly protein [Pseudomonas sp. GD03985]|uniref:pilus assembly PilX family protein n=1 Tax=unclassified Pseudomonas TaxID=196821 RepID=UPI00326409DC